MPEKAYILLNDRERATLLAALHSFQLDMQDGEFRAKEMEQSDEFELLNDTEIDALCERLDRDDELT